MIIQGSNNPLAITFDKPVTDVPILVATLWDKYTSSNPRLLKTWEKEDMIIEDALALCPLTEEETADMPQNGVVLEVKGLDENGQTVFWQRCGIDVLNRFDRTINLTS